MSPVAGLDRYGARLQRALGVTRVARLTELDRAGVEVATAVRPSGHVLQVTQGKGRQFSEAVASALGEAAELAAAESPPREALHFAEGESWTEAQAIGGGQSVLVPAQVVWCGGFGSTWLGPVSRRWSSNGLAAHRSLNAAREHAVLELIERDAVARALPQGWTPRAIERRVELDSPLVEQLARRGFAVFVFDLSTTHRVPVVGALLFDLEEHVVPLTAGYAARRTAKAAAEAALLEAAQSRLTEIHGAREDVMVGDREGGAALLEVLQRSTVRRGRSLRRLPDASTHELRELTRAQLHEVVLGREPLQVVKVMSNQLLTSELL